MARFHAVEDGSVRFAYSFTIPVCAFRVDRVEHTLVGFGGPFKSVRKAILINLVVVINEGACFGSGVGVVGFCMKAGACAMRGRRRG